jgi:DNA-binding transcriptional MerR regulator
MLQAEAGELLLTNHAARILEVSPQTIRAWERAGRLKALKTASGVRLFARTDVEALAKDRRAHKRGAAQPETEELSMEARA